MKNSPMSWGSLAIFLLLCLTVDARYLEGKVQDEDRRKAAVVVGTVYCEACPQQGFSRASHFISDAAVEIQCKKVKAEQSIQQEVKTDKHGVFRVELPFRVTKHVKKIRNCSVKVLNSNEPGCPVPSMAASASLGLKSREGDAYVFSSGVFSFRPKKRPDNCRVSSTSVKSDKLGSRKTLAPSTLLNRPRFLSGPPGLPPLVALSPLPPLSRRSTQTNLAESSITDPVSDTKRGSSHGKKGSAGTAVEDKETVQPQAFFPPNPFQPPSIFPPNPFQPPPSIFPPNPFQPPPSIFPPNPFQPPSPPPSIFPPNPFQPQPPPPAPLIPPLPPLPSLPPIPGLSPPPPPPPPPPFLSFPPFPFPPFPFPPFPKVPGPPPASSPDEKRPAP